MRTRLIAPVVCALAALVLVGCMKDPAAVADDTAGVGASSRELGFDPAELNDAVHPGDDFFDYINQGMFFVWGAHRQLPKAADGEYVQSVFQRVFKHRVMESVLG